jgi:hypothetical protein
MSRYLKTKQGRQCTNMVTLRCFRETIVAMERQFVVFRKYMFVASGSQREMCMRHVVMHGLCCFTVFCTLSHKRQVFRKRSYGTLTMCFDFLYNLI